MTTTAITRPARAASSRAKPAPFPANSESYKPLFVAISDLLNQAWATDESHAYSGESDRLLGVAAGLAAAAPKEETTQDSRCRAFDIGACINAARLVPGDVESSERSALLGQVAAILTEITEVSDCIRTNVPRPELPTAKVTVGARDAALIHFDALCYMDCAQAVLDLHADNANSAAIYGLRDLLRTYYARVDKAADGGTVTQDDLEEVSSSLEIICSLIQQSLECSELDSVVLHAVDYLLCDAKAIADGERDEAKKAPHEN